MFERHADEQSQTTRTPEIRARRLVGWTLRLAGLGLLAALALALFAGWTAFGKRAQGRARPASPRRRNGATNVSSIRSRWSTTLASRWRAFFHSSRYTSPSAPLPVVTDDAQRFATPPASGLRVTWLGHSTTLLEVDGTAC